MFGQEVTLLRSRGTTVDRNNNTVADWTSPSRVYLTDSLVAPRSSADLAAPERNGVVVGVSLYVRDRTVQLRSTDRFVIDGDTYEVDGIPGAWGAWGVEVALKRVEG